MTNTDRSTFRHRRAILATALALFLPGSAVADLTGHAQSRDALAGRSDHELMAANPVLARLAREDPTLLHEVLGRLRAPTSSYSRSLAKSRPDPNAAETAILDENPDFAELYRESPEAALDLLRLIREAAKQK